MQHGGTWFSRHILRETYLLTYYTRTITLTHLIIAAYVARVTLLPACKYRLTMLPYILALVLS